jgi:SAM-dependent methyltransferase
VTPAALAEPRLGGAFFDSAYDNASASVQAQVRRETYDGDIGQTSWLELAEWRAFAARLGVGPGSTVLDVACGSGGPALQLVRDTGAAVVGVDLHSDAIAAASSSARFFPAQSGSALEALARFVQADARKPLAFDDASFDAITCIDAIHHFPDRAAVLADWRRLLRPGGVVLFTDPVVVTGLVSREELDVRASVGWFGFTPPGENERLLAAAGLEVVRRDDATEAMAAVAARWERARSRHVHALESHEGRDVYVATQRFLRMTAKLAGERRLSRHVLVARRVDHASRPAAAGEWWLGR